jgi:hypothetical protein
LKELVMSEALRNVVGVMIGDQELKFDPPVSIWQALAQVQKAKREATESTTAAPTRS